MRAKKVNENIDFQRGQKAKDALSIGSWAVGKTIDYYYYHCILHSRNNYWAKTDGEILENTGDRITIRYWDEGRQKTEVIDTNRELIKMNKKKYEEQVEKDREERSRWTGFDSW